MPKQTEEMIRSLSLFPEENPFPVLRIDADGILRFANRAAKALLKQWRCVIGGLVPDLIRHEVEMALVEDARRELEVPCIRRIFSFVLVPIVSRGYVNLYGRDVTEHRQAEEALRESEQHYRNLFHNNHAIMLLIDPGDGRIVDANAAACNYYGYPQGVLRQLAISDINTLPAERVRVEMQRAMAAERRHFFFRHRLADGDIRDVEAFSGPIVMRGRELLYSIIYDITDRSRAEQQIVRLNTELQARAEELESANRELEAFNYTVAHDLRRPLTLINGYSQILRELYCHKLDHQSLGYLKIIYDSTLSMGQTLDALLNFSQLLHAELQPEAIDLSALVREVASELKLADPERLVSFRIADRISVEGDTELLRLVVSNLLGNAWKYTVGRQEALIEFGASNIDGETVCFIRDNGIGFNREDSQKLFLPFHRLSSNEGISGFGIGLATAERIIRRHGGEIWADGTPGEGATFYFIVGTRSEMGAGTGPDGGGPRPGDDPAVAVRVKVGLDASRSANRSRTPAERSSPGSG